MAVEFFDQPLEWDAAEQAFRDRLSVPRDAFYGLAEELRQFAWTLSRVAQLSVMRRCQRKLAGLVETGGTLADFRHWLEQSSQVWSRWYSDLVFRMAWNASYSRARYREMTDPEIAEEFEWLLYDGISDARQTDFCKALDGKAWRREDFPEELWVPNHFNERSEVRTANRDLLDRSGFKVVTGDQGTTPAEGFNHNQNADLGGMLDETLANLRRQVGS